MAGLAQGNGNAAVLGVYFRLAGKEAWSGSRHLSHGLLDWLGKDARAHCSRHNQVGICGNGSGVFLVLGSTWAGGTFVDLGKV